MKKLKPYARISGTLLALVFSSVHLALISGLKLDSEGYYDIVVAVNEKTAQNDNEDYVKNLKSGIQDLSDAIHESTKQKFVIRSADILLPAHWNTETDDYVTTQTFKNSDIRISHEYNVPEAINPVFCAYPGHYIQLPYNFFDEPDKGPYGPTGKALLTLWARLRWGAHEEHGYPGDNQFPYYWKEMRLPTDPFDKPEEWRVTNCSNAELRGEFKNLDGDECGSDPNDKDLLYPPPADCRFQLNESQTATSSLMSFQFINSLLDFCDEETHNKRAPNRQNHFCQWKSIWETIRESPDWKFMEENSTVSRSPVKFKIVKQRSTKPLLFVLTEGVNKPPPEIIASISSGFGKIFDTNSTKNWNILSSIGVFPGEAKIDSHDTVYPWNYPWFDKARYISTFEETFETRSEFRNFGAAIQDVGNRIRDMDHKEGAIILIIKYGEDADSSMQSYFQAFEGEVLGTILEQNIKIFALEGYDQQGERLKNVADLTKGLHFRIGDGTETDKANIEKVFEAIEETLEAGSIPPSRYRLAHKEVIVAVGSDSGIPRTVPVMYGNVKRTLFYFHGFSMNYMSPDPEIIKGPDGVSESDFPRFQETLNWGKDDFNFRSYFAEFNQPVQSDTDWEYSFQFDYWDYVYTMIIVIVELEDNANLEDLPGKDVSISVSTSAELDHFVDLNVENSSSLKGSTFSVFAKIEKNGHPIKSEDLEVKAHIVYFKQNPETGFSGLTARQVVLLDDGNNGPDMTANDGIFSGSYIPMSYPSGDEGVYQIFVTAILNPTTRRKNMNSTSIKSPIPIDQESIRCGSGYSGCWVETVTEPFVVYADLKRRIEFRGSPDYSFKSGVFRTIDLQAVPVPPGSNIYNLMWTEPVHLTEVGRTSARYYELYQTEHFFNIFTGEGLIALPVASPTIPGRLFIHTLNYVDPGSKYYFVMRAQGAEDAPMSVWSNVAFLHAANPYIETTTAATTPVTPVSTTATTRLPTSPSTPSTPPTLSTTTPSTTPTTRRTTPSTTRTTTTVTTTTTPRSTVRYDVTTPKQEHWYSSKEAIATFSVFGVAAVGIIGGAVTYMRMASGG